MLRSKRWRFQTHELLNVLLKCDSVLQNVKRLATIFSCVTFLYISMTYHLQHQVFLASCYQLSNKFRECVLQRYYNTTKLWHSNWKVGFWTKIITTTKLKERNIRAPVVVLMWYQPFLLNFVCWIWYDVFDKVM